MMMKIFLFFFLFFYNVSATAVDTEVNLGKDHLYSFLEMRATMNVRNKLSDSVRELVRFYEEFGELTADEYLAKYVYCDEFRDAKFFIVNEENPRFGANNCTEWRFLFENLRLNQVFLGDYLTNSAIAIVESGAFGFVPKELQTRSEVLVIGQYEEIPSECASEGFFQIPPVNKTFVHKAQVTINWRRDITDNFEWKIVQFRQLLFQRWRWEGVWSDEQFLFSGSGPILPC